MLPATELAACGLAACAAVDIWLYGSILATARARIQARGGRLAELASCRLCLTAWAAAAAAALAAHGGPPGHALVAVLAIHRLAGLIHDWAADDDDGPGA